MVEFHPRTGFGEKKYFFLGIDFYDCNVSCKRLDDPIGHLFDASGGRKVVKPLLRQQKAEIGQVGVLHELKI